MQNEREKLVKELARECTTVEDVQEKLRDLILGLDLENSPFDL